MPRSTIVLATIVLAAPASGWQVAISTRRASQLHVASPPSSSLPRLQACRVPALHASAEASPPPPSSRAPALVYKLNSSTKWLVVAAQTIAVWWRRDFVAPYIVLGSIVASFGTGTLKRLINQQRPDGAPFTDPGMPSSHALVSAFAAVGWTLHVVRVGRSAVASAALLSSAALVSVLRVACGYHSWAQVIVGGLVGSSSAFGWMRLGDAVTTHVEPRVALLAVWSLYLSGSAAFIAAKMRNWVTEEKQL